MLGRVDGFARGARAFEGGREFVEVLKANGGSAKGARDVDEVTGASSGAQ
jgi:hypothetical protein